MREVWAICRQRQQGRFANEEIRRNLGQPEDFLLSLRMNGGDDETRTGDLCRNSAARNVFDNLQRRGYFQTPRKSHKDTQIVGCIVGAREAKVLSFHALPKYTLKGAVSTR